jgi:hypothetical protein
VTARLRAKRIGGAVFASHESEGWRPQEGSYGSGHAKCPEK